MSRSCLVAYATTHGHTALIAQRIAQRLERHGIAATVHDVRRSDISPADYDLVVVGGSVHAGHHQRELTEWLMRHHDVLAARTTALFSVSLAAAEDSIESRAAVHDYVEELCREGGFTPTIRTMVAGALLYEKYGFPTRVLMRLIARRHDQETDPSQDVDYTDWDSVDRFAGELAALAVGGTVGAAD